VGDGNQVVESFCVLRGAGKIVKPLLHSGLCLLRHYFITSHVHTGVWGEAGTILLGEDGNA
jgi:hypothetical protein